MRTVVSLERWGILSVREIRGGHSETVSLIDIICGARGGRIGAREAPFEVLQLLVARAGR